MNIGILIATAILTTASLALAQATGLKPPFPKVPHADRKVGIAYTTWFTKDRWTNIWGTPELGPYESDDPAVIRQHAAWLAEAGVDFIWIDWSNNIQYAYSPDKKNPTFDMIEGSTQVIFDEYAALRAGGKPTPGISIFAGVTGHPESATDGRLKKKVDQIHDQFIKPEKYKGLWPEHDGKPLLVIYVNTPSPYQDGTPDFHDDRFTVRWMTGYVTEQPALRDGEVSKYGYWSWEDRGRQTYTVHDGRPEAMVVVASYRPQHGQGPDQKGQGYIPAAGRNDGATFKSQWARARAIGPRFAMVVSFNEWLKGEQPSAEVSKDLEPSKEFGHRYLELLREEIRRFKSE